MIPNLPSGIKKILLVGNPNVGKSVLFSRLTGINVVASNYAGTTVEFCRGCIGTGKNRMDVIDVPGTYSLEASSPAEQVAVDMIKNAIQKKDSIIINVVDATNLERNLNLTLQLLKKDIPVIVALNLWDEAHHIGITIDVVKLQEILQVPVTPTVAITGEGIKELVSQLGSARKGTYQYQDEERWHEIGNIIQDVQVIKHKHHTIYERIGDLTVHPWTGIPLAIMLLLGVFFLVRLIGEGLINFILDPLFNTLWSPVIHWLSGIVTPGTFLHSVLIGELVDGVVDYGVSFGLLTTGLYVPLAAVLPYVFAFYLVLSILEDTGYLPRLAVLLDKTMHAVGLHGMAIIPMFLACGCNVPGILGTRLLETKRERFIAAILMAIAIPCAAQTAMIFGLLGKHGLQGLLPVFTTLFLVWLIAGLVMRFFVKGESPEIFTEIPPYRAPHPLTISKKVWMRIRWFFREALPFVLLGVLIVNGLHALGIISLIGKIVTPIMTRVLGLPVEAVGALIIGFLRKDLALGMLAPMGLTVKQLIIVSVLLTMYFPCIATFTVLLRELGFVDMLKAGIIMVVSSISVGFLLNIIL